VGVGGGRGRCRCRLIVASDRITVRVSDDDCFCRTFIRASGFDGSSRDVGRFKGLGSLEEGLGFARCERAVTIKAVVIAADANYFRGT
jgi:hypothetical protein